MLLPQRRGAGVHEHAVAEVVQHVNHLGLLIGVALGSESPVSFDVNTVQPGVLRLIPAITEPEISAWLDQRARKPFAGAADFRSRSGLRDATLAARKL